MTAIKDGVTYWNGYSIPFSDLPEVTFYTSPAGKDRAIVTGSGNRYAVEETPEEDYAQALEILAIHHARIQRAADRRNDLAQQFSKVKSYTYDEAAMVLKRAIDYIIETEDRP